LQYYYCILKPNNISDVKAIEKVNEKLPGYETGARIANQRWDLIKEEYEKMMGPCDMKGRSFPSSYSRDKKTLMDLLEVHNKNFLVNYQDP
jgi:hypothetical protein